MARHALQHLFGRDLELDEIRSALEQAQRSLGSLLLVSGEPGIGKTRLADAAASVAEDKGFRVFWGQCWENNAAPPFWPWIQILRDLGISRNASEAYRRDAEYLLSIIPELRDKPEAASIFSQAGSLNFAQEGDSYQRFQLFDAIRRVLQGATGEAPLLLIIDDCHAADASSLVLLEFLARELHRQRIVLLITHREAEVRAKPELNAFFKRLSRQANGLPLQGLDEQNVAEMLSEQEGPPDASIAHLLYRATEGNPFFLVQLTRWFKRAGLHQIPAEENLKALKVPEELKNVIRRRLDAVSAITRTVLDAAAVLGAEFDVQHVGATAEVAQEIALASIKEALQLDLLIEVGGRTNKYKFSHSLFRHSLYADIDVPRRARMHFQAAATQEADGTGFTEPAMLAYHYLRAIPLGEVSTAISYVNRAADNANASLAWERAVALHEDAISTLKEFLNSAPKEHADQLVKLATAEHRSGRYQNSNTNFRAAMELAREAQDPELFARAVLGLGIFPSRPGKFDSELVWALEEALRSIRDPDNATRALLLARLAEAMQWDDLAERRIAYSLEAVKIARGITDEVSRFEVLNRAHVAMSGPDRLADRKSIAAELTGIADKLASPLFRWRSTFIQIASLIEIGDVLSLDREIENYKYLNNFCRQEHIGQLEAVMAMRTLMDGRFDEAENYAIKAMNLGNERRDKLPIYASAAQFGAIKREQAKLAEIVPLIESFVAESPSFSFARCGLAFCYVELGRREQAEFHFNQLATDEFRTLQRNVSWLAGMFLLAEVCSFLGDQNRASALYKLLAPYASRNAVLDVYVVYGSVDYALALLSTVLLNFEDAELHFEEALRIGHSMGSQPIVARTEYCYAEMLLSQNVSSRREYGLKLLERTQKKAKELKMVVLAEKARLLATSWKLGDAGQGSISLNNESDSDSIAGTVTILFSDIENSTPLFERMGDLKAQEVIRSHNTIMRKLVREHGGSEIKTTGDGFMIAFASARQAIRCAIEAQRKFVETAKSGLEQIRVRIGVHTGEVIRESGDLFGKCVIIAARLSALAEGAEILVSSTTKEIIESAGDDIHFDTGKVLKLKGLSSTYTAYAVNWVTV